MREHLMLVVLLVMARPVSAQNMLSGPDGVVYDSTSNRYLIANVASGLIVEIDSLGNQRAIIQGLMAPVGLCIVDDILYVSVNGPMELAGYDLSSAMRVKEISIAESESLRGIAADTAGGLYVVGQSGNVYSVDLFSDSYTTLADLSSVISAPGDLCYVEESHSLWVVGWAMASPIMVIDLNTMGVSQMSHTPGNNFGITRDSYGNTYVSSWATNAVHVFDPTLSSPADTFSFPLDRPTGLCYTPHDDMLAMTCYGSSTIHFKHIMLETVGTPTLGCLPLGVRFSGSTREPIETWTWLFGDGDTAHTSTCFHDYTDPGVFDVTLEVETAESTNFSLTKKGYITVVADSLIGTDTGGTPGATVELTVNATNSIPLHQITLPVEYFGFVDLTYNGYSVAGCRTEHFDEVKYLNFSGTTKQLTIQLNALTAQDLLPGEGPIIKLSFVMGDGGLDDTTYISLDGHTTNLPSFSGTLGTYQPSSLPGKVSMLGCCAGGRGNADCSTGDEVDIADVTALIRHLFITLEPLCCKEEADLSPAEQPDGMVDIGDVTVLIGHLFISLDELAVCL